MATSTYPKHLPTPGGVQPSLNSPRRAKDPLTTSPLPRSAYNYEPYTPPAPPVLSIWSRKHLYDQMIFPSAPVYLTCNLRNPVHLASVLAHGAGWEVVEMLVEGMTAASAIDADMGRNVKEGVLLGGLAEEAMGMLEGVFERRGCVRSVVDVRVKLEGGEEAIVAAYTYQLEQT